MKAFIDIIIPTFDNYQMLSACLSSFLGSIDTTSRDMLNIIVVNNGKPEMKEGFPEMEGVTIYNAGANLGWEGGLKFGLQYAKAPFVIFANDDIRLLQGHKQWVWNMLSTFNDPAVGAAGPCSNFVMGQQNIFYDSNKTLLETKYLIGFFLMLRREALEKAGGVDDTLPGGDDIDLSIRLRDAGYKLVCRRDVFVYHHGAQTGNRVHEGYWNSHAQQEKTNFAIIRKHGMLKFWETVVIGWMEQREHRFLGWAQEDVEGDLCRRHIEGEAVLELGCGGTKTVPNAVAIDLRRAGAHVSYVTEGKDISVADLVGDASLALPVVDGSQDTIIARHLLEHCQDTVGTLSAWNRALKKNGKLIIAVPNNALGNTIIMNPEHVVSFVPSSLRNAAACAGLALSHLYTEVNGVSFVAVFEKIEAPHWGVHDPKATLFPEAARREEELAAA